MPVDRAAWKRELHLSNFANAYYQYRDVARFVDARRLLIVGPGQGLDTHVFKWRGFDVTTFDIDDTFAPDVLGSVHDMRMFADGEFDVVIASHVLEHLAVVYLDAALKEIARVGRFALVYLPVAGRHLQIRLVPGFRNIDLSFVCDVFNYVARPDGVTNPYCQGHHFWEIGRRGFTVRDLRRRLGRDFEIIDDYRNRDWVTSYNFVLRSRRNSS
jgi:predicted SAM-dependent methyltransferase